MVRLRQAGAFVRLVSAVRFGGPGQVAQEQACGAGGSGFGRGHGALGGVSRRFGTGFGDGGALPSDGGLVPHVAGISWGRVVGRFGWLACAGVPGRAAFTLVGVVDAARRVGPAPVVQMARAG